MPESSVALFVADIDGVRGRIAEDVAQTFPTVADLSDADPATLTSIQGVGPVLAERILDAARTAVIADHTPEDEPDPDPATRARARVAQARASTRPSLDVIDGDVDDPVPTATVTPDATTGGTNLPPAVERLAHLVGTTLGWTIRLVRGAAQPVRHLLQRG